MMPGSNPYRTRIINAPASCPECHPLELCDAKTSSGPVMISAWEPSDEEIEAIKNGERIWLFIYGASHPMVAITVGASPFDDVG